MIVQEGIYPAIKISFQKPEDTFYLLTESTGLVKVQVDGMQIDISALSALGIRFNKPKTVTFLNDKSEPIWVQNDVTSLELVKLFVSPYNGQQSLR